MIYCQPLRCIIPPERRSKDIVRLEIHAADHGYYLFQFADFHATSKWDSFYHDFDEVLTDCMSVWGIPLNAWHSITERPD